jgi:hypothetical protein
MYVRNSKVAYVLTNQLISRESIAMEGSHSGWLSPNCVHSARRPLLAYCTCLGDCEDGEFDEMKIGRGNRSTRRKPAPAPLCPPQIPLDQTRAPTWAAAVGNQRLAASAVEDYIWIAWKVQFASGIKFPTKHIQATVFTHLLSSQNPWMLNGNIEKA